ncbi:leucine-rich repeat-containing protein 49 [Bacillus rossius redtenbacheri]|uniref:leucine-rich repeat-containing protein 49 n=1 Tax=Bacillus rossius redtenbacheri TaxID=93214 RepID=UPI002FDEC622
MNCRSKSRVCNMMSDVVEVAPTEVVLQTTHEGRIQAVRTRKDKDKNPDRMSLDRRGLTQLPVIVGEPRLRLLSLQHNLLSRLDGLGALGLSRLVFLDLYDNQLERLSGVDALENLRILLAGKNRIRRIEGLSLLVRLEVLDLHGNQIYQIGGLKTLGELKVLNMAGNQIRAVGNTDLQGLRSLQELNLRRNRIKRLSGFADTPQLQKLFVSNNELLTVESLSGVAEASQLRELSVDGNPVAAGGECASFLVSRLPRLRLLSRAEVTAAVRQAAAARRGDGREQVISNARTNWELLRSRARCESWFEASDYQRTLMAGGETDVTKEDVTECLDADGDLGNQFQTEEDIAQDVLSPTTTQQDTDEEDELELLSKQNISSARQALHTLINIVDSTSDADLQSYYRHFRAAPTSLSSSLRDLRADMDVTGAKAPERHIQSDSGVSGMASSGCAPPQSRSVVSISAEVRRLKFSHRTVSQDSDTSQNTASSSSVDYFKLPPILATTFSVEMGIPEGEPPAGWRDRRDRPEERRHVWSAHGSIGAEQQPAADVAPGCESSSSSLPSDSSSSCSEADDHDDPGSSGGGKVAAEEPARNAKSATPYRKHSCRRVQARPTTSRPPPKSSGKVREQGGDFLVEISGRVLNVYGQGSLRFIDRPWSAGKAQDVTTARFHYVNFNAMIHVLGRMKQRFAGAEHFAFRETNISHLGQLNALADVQGLSSLRIEPEGNPIVLKEWQSYAVYRLGHWGLHVVNDKEVSEDEASAASEEFQGLSDLVLWSLPDSLLQPLLARLRLDDGARPASAKQWLWGADPALRAVVSKEALQWRRGGPSQVGEDVMWRRRGRIYFGRLLEVVCAAVEKLRLLEDQWQSILLELITETLVDYSHLDSYMKKCMAALK